MCNFLNSVSLQQKFEVADLSYSLGTAQCKSWNGVTAWLKLSFIWQARANTSSRCECGPTQKEQGLNFGSSF